MMRAMGATGAMRASARLNRRAMAVSTFGAVCVQTAMIKFRATQQWPDQWQDW